MARVSCAWRTVSTPISATCGRRSPIPAAWRAGLASSRATCAWAVSSGHAFSPADGKVPGGEGPGGVEVCEAPRHLLVMTKDDGQADEHAIEATLTADGDHTILILEERGMPVNLLAAYGAGIQVHIEDLAAHIAGRGRCDAEARWKELQPAYEALASKLG